MLSVKRKHLIRLPDRKLFKHETHDSTKAWDEITWSKFELFSNLQTRLCSLKMTQACARNTLYFISFKRSGNRPPEASGQECFWVLTQGRLQNRHHLAGNRTRCTWVEIRQRNTSSLGMILPPEYALTLHC